jgi:hypothetical protein
MCEIPRWTPPRTMNIHSKNEGQEGKTGLVWEWVPLGGGKVNGETEEGGYGACTLYMYENRTVKPVEIVLRWGEGWGRMMRGVNLIKIHCKHICKCHNVYLYNYYMLINTFF